MAIKDSLFKSIVANKPVVVSNRSRFDRLRGIELSSPLPSSSIEEEGKCISEKSALIPDTNRTQTGNKPDTNWEQTGHKPDTGPDKNWEQTGDKPDTNRTQLSPPVAVSNENRTQSGHETEHNIGHKLGTNRTQIGHKSDTKLSFSSCIGIQKDILIFLYQECKNNRTKISPELTLEYIAEALNIRVGSVKTSIKRLEKKGALERVKFKNGRGGWSQYELSDVIYHDIMQYETAHKLHTKWVQTGYKVDTKLGTQLNTSASSSSSNIINTTTTGATDSVLEPDWQALDLEPLKTFGFSSQHLKQLATQRKLSPLEVQDSIYAFAFDLQENDKGKSLKTTPLNFFMGILRNGQVYTPPENYESPQDRSRRLYLERKRQQHEQRLAQERELLNYEFEDWYQTLTPEEISHITPYIKGEKGRRAVLLDHFQREVWQKNKELIER